MLPIFISFDFSSLKSSKNERVTIIKNEPEPIREPQMMILSRRFASGMKIIVIKPAKMKRIALRRRYFVHFVSFKGFDSATQLR